jgi:predicted nucleic acid-binding protein
VTYTALLDANVLHPMVLCDLLIRLAQHGLFRARWSRRILNEVVRSIARRRTDLPLSKLERRIDMMNQAVADAEVEESEELTGALSVFGDDAHVVAAAILGRADVIVTSNLVDFPSAALRPFHLVAQSPDGFLMDQWGFRPDIVLQALREQAAALTHPAMSPSDVVDRLRPSVPRFAAVVHAALNDEEETL